MAVLLAVLAGLFALQAHPIGQRIFKVVPLLVFAYFIPTVLSNVGFIPISCPLYEFIGQWLLPASLILLTMSVDIPAIMKLGRNVLILFLAATATIVLGGPLAYLAFGWAVPAEMGDQAWRGLAALSGSWIGGGANFVAIGKSVDATDSTLAMMVVVDVALSNVWMAVLLFFAGREKEMDAALGVDRSSLEALKLKIESFQRELSKPVTLGGLLAILFVAFAATVDARYLASFFPAEGAVMKRFTWTVIIVTTIGVGISFTPLRRLEEAGASKVGSMLLYLLVASIGAKAEFSRVLEAPALLLVGAIWITFHAVILMALRHRLRAPIFYAAVGSQANIGGAASAPIVAGAFHPALAPVGVLLGVAGYVMGTYAGLLCAVLLELVSRLH